MFRVRVGRVSPFIPRDEDHAEGEERLGPGTSPRVEQPEGHEDPPKAILLVGMSTPPKWRTRKSSSNEPTDA